MTAVASWPREVSGWSLNPLDRTAHDEQAVHKPLILLLDRRQRVGRSGESVVVAVL